MIPNIESFKDIIHLLNLVLSSQENRISAIKMFQNYIWNTPTSIPGATAEQRDYLDDLALDLDYYEPNPVYRAEDPFLYGDQQLETEIVKTLRKLREVAPSSYSGGDDGA